MLTRASFDYAGPADENVLPNLARRPATTAPCTALNACRNFPVGVGTSSEPCRRSPTMATTMITATSTSTSTRTSLGSSRGRA
jgi:hypothetical protein